MCGMMMKENAMNKLDKLKNEQKTLEETILTLLKTPLCDQLAIQRLKRRKLQIKDEIIKLRARLIPDIIA
ncbi:MAG: hypothetical protein ACD_16C00224G0012 [uncultured bacterium]|nr:MAG: hypothetical protein ACD_16C00224G0012 [uncultured bacterium]